MTTLDLTTSPAGTWPLTVEGQAKSPTAAEAQASFSTFLKSASDSRYLGLPSRSPTIKIHAEEPPVRGAKARTGAVVGPDAVPPPIRLEDIPPLERPRDVEVVRVRNVPIYRGCDVVGYRRKFTIAVPANIRRQGVVPKEWTERVAAYNALWDDEKSCRVKAAAITGAEIPEPPPSPPFVGTVLDFTLSFEVKK
jgi:hypothetical protein